MFKGRSWRRGIAVAVAVLALAGVTVGVVSAHGGGGWLGRGGVDREALLAEELGITVDRLQEAQEAARVQALEQALEQGLITQEQYDQMQLRLLVEPYFDRQVLLAQALGIEPNALAEKSLAEWLEELDLDRQTLTERLEDAYGAALEQAVADGVITQEQADTLLDKGLMRMFGRDLGRPMGRGGRKSFGRLGEAGPRSNQDCETDALQNNSINLRVMPGSNRF